LSLKQAGLLIEFDKLKRDYQEHQYEIHSKLVSILQERLIVHCASFKSIDWENINLPGEGKANAYMETLVKEITTLHKVLSRYLHSSTVDSIMIQVFNSTEESLKLEMAAVELKSETVRQKLLVDAQYLRTKLGELKGLEIPTPGEVSFLCGHSRISVPTYRFLAGP
jgi:vacuolar protein sorting-associated protein 54